MTRLTSTDYTNPYRPRLIRALNRVGSLLDTKLGFHTALEPDSLIREARKKTGLVDFGEPDIGEPLGRLIDSIEAEARLHPVGRFITRQRLTGVLANRLRLQHFLESHPELAKRELPPVILITGMQRTGTTLLHRLLSSDSNIRALLSYEALQPVPIHADPNRDKDRKLAFARRAERGLTYLAPDFFAIHPVEANAPEEDVLLLDASLLSTVPESTLRVPSYAAWVEAADNKPAYKLLASILKVLGGDTPPPCWVLKSPHHLEFLDLVLDIFPCVTIVQTHRDPAATLPSFCSMMAHARGIFTDEVDPIEIGEHWLRKTVYMTERGLAARKNRGKERFIDVYYEDLLANPLEEMKRIYDKASLEFSSEVQLRLKQALTENVQHRYGIHSYSMEAFGLTEQAIHKAYESYLNEFEVPLVSAKESLRTDKRNHG